MQSLTHAEFVQRLATPLAVGSVTRACRDGCVSSRLARSFRVCLSAGSCGRVPLSVCTHTHRVAHSLHALPHTQALAADARKSTHLCLLGPIRLVSVPSCIHPSVTHTRHTSTHTVSLCVPGITQHSPCLAGHVGPSAADTHTCGDKCSIHTHGVQHAQSTRPIQCPRHTHTLCMHATRAPFRGHSHSHKQWHPRSIRGKNTQTGILPVQECQMRSKIQ